MSQTLSVSIQALWKKFSGHLDFRERSGAEGRQKARASGSRISMVTGGQVPTRSVCCDGTKANSGNDFRLLLSDRSTDTAVYARASRHLKQEMHCGFATCTSSRSTFRCLPTCTWCIPCTSTSVRDYDQQADGPLESLEKQYGDDTRARGCARQFSEFCCLDACLPS